MAVVAGASAGGGSGGGGGGAGGGGGGGSGGGGGGGGSSNRVAVVVVIGPYRVFDGGVFADRLFKITGRRSILSIICHELARAAKRIFCREPLSHKK